MRESGIHDFGPPINADKAFVFNRRSSALIGGQPFLAFFQQPVLDGVIARPGSVLMTFCVARLSLLHMPASAAVLDEVTHEFSRRPQNLTPQLIDIGQLHLRLHSGDSLLERGAARKSMSRQDPKRPKKTKGETKRPSSPRVFFACFAPLRDDPLFPTFYGNGKLWEASNISMPFSEHLRSAPASAGLR